MILQGPRNNLSRRGRVPVHNHHNRIRLTLVAGTRRVNPLRRVPALVRNDHVALANQMIHNRHSFRQQPTRIAPQIQNQALQLIFLQFLQAFFKLPARRLIELFHPDVANLRLQREDLRYTLPVDVVSNNVEHQRLFIALTCDMDLNRRALLAPQQFRNFGGIQTLSRFVVHHFDGVARPQTSLIGRRTHERNHHHGLAIPAHNRHPNTRVPAALVFPQVFKVLRVKEVRVGVQGPQHPRNRTLKDGFVRVHLIRKILVQRVVNIGELPHAGLNVLVGRRSRSGLEPLPIYAADQRAGEQE